MTPSDWLASTDKSLSAMAAEIGVDKAVLSRVFSGVRDPTLALMAAVFLKSEGQVRDIDWFRLRAGAAGYGKGRLRMPTVQRVRLVEKRIASVYDDLPSDVEP